VPADGWQREGLSMMGTAVYNTHKSGTQEAGMLKTLVKNWWLISLRGLVALILGIIMLAMQPLAAAALLVIFGVLLIAMGFSLKGADVDKLSQS
jgi:uncharacterized membrane protein HdeD (DUF308 family)